MEFKVGDWVKSTKFLNMKPAKIVSIYESNERKGDFGLRCCGTVHYASEAELWKPKEGEWVIPFDELYKDSFLVQQYNEEEHHLNCEPFIGQLPSCIKDKQ